MKTLFRIARLLSIIGLGVETLFLAFVTLSKTVLKDILAELTGGYEFSFYSFVVEKLGANWAVALFALSTAIWLLYTLIYSVKSGRSASGKDVMFFFLVFLINALLIAASCYLIYLGIAVPYFAVAIAVAFLQGLCCFAPGRYFRRIRR